MAKKVKHPSAPVEVSPGANPYGGVSNGKRLGTILGSICMILFIVFDELWVGTAACAACLGVLFVLQVFVEKSKVWYKSLYLYTFLLSAVMAWLEYSSGWISELMKIG